MLYEAVKFKIRTQDFGLFQCSDNATFRQSPHDILIVVAAGNSMENLDDNKNCFYPVCFDAANMLAVREVNFNGIRDVLSCRSISGSNHGIRRVHRLCPGRILFSFRLSLMLAILTALARFRAASPYARRCSPWPDRAQCGPHGLGAPG
jgi:hypothetical protein